MKFKFLLIFIFSLAFTLRVWAIDSLPVGFTPDEASFGYDAYSILKTGKDQWGRTMPIALESFGDFKMPLYTYITMPFVALFGLTKFAVRMPNAIFGSLAVVTTYFLVLQLFKAGAVGINSSKVTKNTLNPVVPAVISAALLSINPWHIMMSRGAFEANLTTLLLPLGILIFLKGLENKKYLLLCGLILGLNMFSYHSARFVTPLIIIVLIVIYRKILFPGLTKLSLLILPFSLFLGLSFYTLFTGSLRRASDITIFSGALNQASEKRFIDIYQGLSIPAARLFNNKFQVVASRFFNNYQQYFSADFLFIKGPAEGTYGMLPGRGTLYLFELPFLIAFLYSVFILRRKNAFLVILLWLLIAPIPAALTSGRGFAANRSVIMLPALTIASSMGFYATYLFLKSRINRLALGISGLALIAVTAFSFISFAKDYFVVSPYINSKDMLFGNLEVGYWLKDKTELTPEIIVSKKLSEPHIFIAFSHKWDPTEYQKNTADWNRYSVDGLKFVDQLGSYKLGKYTFTDIEYKKYQNQKDILLVGKDEEFPPEAKRILKYIYPDGEGAIVVVEPFNEAYALINPPVYEKPFKNN